MIVAFFAAFMVLLSGFAWIAFHTYTGQVTEDAYKKGLAYNTTIREADVQKELHWSSNLTVMPQGHRVDIAFTLKDAAGHAIDDARVIALISRPTQSGHDKTLTLYPSGKGHYRGRIALDWSGAWNVRISATENGHNYQQSKSMVLK